GNRCEPGKIDRPSVHDQPRGSARRIIKEKDGAVRVVRDGRTAGATGAVEYNIGRAIVRDACATSRAAVLEKDTVVVGDRRVAGRAGVEELDLIPSGRNGRCSGRAAAEELD